MVIISGCRVPAFVLRLHDSNHDFRGFQGILSSKNARLNRFKYEVKNPFSAYYLQFIEKITF